MKNLADISTWEFKKILSEVVRAELKKLNIPKTVEDLQQRDILSTQIWHTNLSIRAINRLNGHNIKTVADLLKTSKRDLMMFRNLGPRTLYDIETFIKGLKIQLCLKNINIMPNI